MPYKLNLLRVETYGQKSKFYRFTKNPLKYIFAIFYRDIIYKFRKKKIVKKCNTFFDDSMSVILPSSTDIFLAGGKTHQSEINLSKFLCEKLSMGDIFIDVGAHYGFYSLLASKLVGTSGSVFSFEPSPESFKILHKNRKKNMHVYNVAISDRKANLVFYEFPNLYSEFNSIHGYLFKDKKWYGEYKPKEIEVKSQKLDHFIYENKLTPRIIKIDVEGAELEVIRGLKRYLTHNSPIISMEYLRKESNLTISNYSLATTVLNNLGYNSYAITNEGSLILITDISEYMNRKKITSDNIIYMKNLQIN